MSTNNTDGQGVVFRKSHGHYSVQDNGREIACVISSRLHKQLIYPTSAASSLRRSVQRVCEIEHTDPLAIGDEVRFTWEPDGSGMITEVLPRRNKFSRQATTPGQHGFEQVIVSNVDQVVPVFAAASPTPKWGLLDRFLVSCESAGLPVLICITKTDLGGQADELEETLAEYRQIGYRFQLVSTVTNQGLEEFRQLLVGRTSVFVGKSGVGKTSLLNAIQPGLGKRVREVSLGKQGKGRHTTTQLEMFSLEQGGAIVDTPGIREFGLWNVEGDDLALFFPEMRALVGTCKFGLDCLHHEEPGCAIRKAVMAGQVSPYRYKSYLTLRGVA
jgi:ribosome biogenesis GTPase